MMQPWQAYQALMYEEKWKKTIQDSWKKYQAQWMVEHPNEKLKKTCLIYLMEFIKEKLKDETNKMKEEVEDY